MLRGSVVFVFVLLAVCSLPCSSERRHPLKVAVNLPLSGSMATYGTAVQEGVSFALSDLESAGVATHNVSWDWQDNQSDIRTTTQNMAFQLRSKPEIYVSGVKPQIMAIARGIEAAGLPHFAWVYDANVRKIAQHTFRTWVSFAGEAELFVSTIISKRPKRLALIYVQLANTDEQYQELILPKLRAAGITEISVQTYTPDKTDFRDLALRIRSFDPDLMVVNGFQENIIGMIRSFRSQNLIKNGNTIASFDLLDAAPLLPKESLEGILVSCPKFLLSKEAANWKKRFEAKFGRAPLYTHYYAYDMARIIIDASRRAEDNSTPNDIERLIAVTEIQGVTGALSFDGSGDIKQGYEFGTFVDGKLVAAAE